jgi:hypothetical protein
MDGPSRHEMLVRQSSISIGATLNASASTSKSLGIMVRSDMLRATASMHFFRACVVCGAARLVGSLPAGGGALATQGNLATLPPRQQLPALAAHCNVLDRS